jgi:glycosyltransferase involved in cell wall biosynthesis
MRILFLCHGHPDLQAGGTEIFTRDLFRTLRSRPGVEGAFVAGASALHRPQSPGTAIQAIGAANDEMLLWTAGFDRFHLSQTDLHGIAPALHELLETVAPDVVHLHHLLLLGAESLQLIRRLRPMAKIVLTLHDYYAICAHEGTMLTTDGALCRQASPDACARCLPDRSATEFRLREITLRHLLGQVDAFVSPSAFLKQRFVRWGIAADRITVIPNGLAAVTPAPHRDAARRDRFAFFGHINRFKGAKLALDASARLSAEGIAHRLDLHGGAAFQTPDFMADFSKRLEAAPIAAHHGAYDRATLKDRMRDADWVVVPSLWWENAPLVIQEAFAHRRPVIAADIGGMAEMVRHGADGLLFRAGDSRALAEAMAQAAGDQKLWQRLVDGIAPPATLDQAAEAQLRLYASLAAAPARPKRRAV